MASENPENKRSLTDVSRRKFVAAGGAAWASTALAGCTGGDNGGGGNDTTEEPTSTPEPQPENYVVTDDILAGSGGAAPGGAGGFADACSWTRTFTYGMEPVFKVGVYDPATGEQLGSDEISVAINIEGGPSADLGWSLDDDPEAEPEWSGPVWEGIPEDWETGETTYTVEVTDNDGNFQHVGIASGVFEVVDYQVPTNYVVTDQTYATGDIDSAPPEDYPYSKGCLEQDIFSPDIPIGFDVGIWNGQTGEMVGADDIESAEIQFTNAEMDPVELKFEPAANEDSNGTWDRTDSEGNIDEDHAWNAVVRSVPSDFAESGGKKLMFDIVVTPMTPEDGEAPEVNPVGVYRNYVTIVPTPSSSS